MVKTRRRFFLLAFSTHVFFLALILAFAEESAFAQTSGASGRAPQAVEIKFDYTHAPTIASNQAAV